MDQRVNVDRQTGPEKSVAHLREQQGQLRHTDVSCDLSEVSYQTEQTDFQHSRHSSLSAEPLTLDAEQIHDAKERVEDILQTTDPEAAVSMLTKDLDEHIGDVNRKDGEAEILAQQLNSLVEKTKQLVEGYEKQAITTGISTGSFGLKPLVMDKKGEIVTLDQSDVDINATQTVEVTGRRCKELEPVQQNYK